MALLRIVFTGGGTGGHVIPNLAVIEELRARKADVEIVYIGSLRGVERTLAEKAGVRYMGIQCGKLRRYFDWENFVDLLRIPIGIVQAYRLLKKFQPDVVFSKGGFVSLPVVVGAWLARIPVVVHESDISPGLSNRASFQIAKKIFVSMPETLHHIPERKQRCTQCTGPLIRESLFRGNREKGLNFLGFSGEKPVLMVMGGSQGAAQINALLRAQLEVLLQSFHIVHVCGKGFVKKNLTQRGYLQYEFLEDELADVYAAADTVVTRGGAHSLAELMALQKKVVVLPLSSSVSRGDQAENARTYAELCGWRVLSGKVSEDEFTDAILTTSSSAPPECQLDPGTHRVVDLLLTYSHS